ncbi:MAG: AMP-binding protein [Gammaproteobacteria bacterium]|jgi:long-subunit acyl-CoA synthetase (AMP-forming)|nr:AMP-binding protein [Gammaproteobacteria bacterium]
MLTTHQAFLNWSGKNPDREFLLQPVQGVFNVITYREAEDQVRRMAAALFGLGLAPGDKVAILGKNSAEWVLADLAIAMAGMVSVPIYPTANADTVSYILGHSEASAVFVGKLDDPDTVGKAIPQTLPSIAFPYPTAECQYQWQDLINNAEAIAAPNEPQEEDVMTILYTSGSTGRPKGVVISYRAFVYSCNATRKTIGFEEQGRTFSYLPLAHIVERGCVVGPSIFAGTRIYFNESLKSFQHDMKTARPTGFVSVPRLWVKFQSSVHSQIPPRKLRILLAIPIVGRLVARKIRNNLGLKYCDVCSSGSAPISPHTLQWYHKIGVDIGEGWGMSETSGLSCGNFPFQSNRLGTIGVPLEGTELQISEEGELLIRSPGLFTAYYKQPELTQEAFTDDGFFRTGDKANWDEKSKAYKITGRVKDIFKSAKGKYIAPLPIESRLSSNPLFEQVCVIGSGLPAPIAVVVLSDAAQHLPKSSVEESFLATLVDTNAHLESHERISNFFIAKEEWTTENGLLTPTLKVKRDEIEARYLSAISQGFSDKIAWEE